jgi:hypothetical protein
MRLKDSESGKERDRAQGTWHEETRRPTPGVNIKMDSSTKQIRERNLTSSRFSEEGGKEGANEQRTSCVNGR